MTDRRSGFPLGAALTLEELDVDPYAAFAAPSRAGARLVGPGPRRLARDAARPVHRGHARRGPLHRRRPTLLDRSGRRSEHALARRRCAQTPPRPVREGVPRPGRAGTVRRAGRRRGPAPRGRPRPARVGGDPARPGRPAGGRRRRRRARARRCRATRGARLVCRDRRGRRSGLDWRPRRTEGARRRSRHSATASTRTIDAGDGVLATATATLASDEVASNAAVMLFGGIETSEGMTTTLFWHLLSDPAQLDAVRADRDADRERHRGIAPPGAGGVARRSLCDGRRRPGGSKDQARRSRHRVADSRQSRPCDVRRSGHVRRHATERAGAPHLRPRSARLRRRRTSPDSRPARHSAAALDMWPDMRMAPEATPPSGLIFRKPRSVPVRWD